MLTGGEVKTHEEKPDGGEAYLLYGGSHCDFLVRRRMTPEDESRMPISFTYI